MTRTVAVAMSGGVDSSLAACILKDTGYDVFGVTMNLGPWQSPTVISGAESVAKKLGIPHRVVDLTDGFREGVISYFCEEYFEGRTPNPCIKCNSRIKFGLLLGKVLSSGAEYLATGHYAKLELDESRSRYLIRKANDPSRDQSYFLCRLPQVQLRRILFPLGGYKKHEIKTMARRLNLPVQRRESREVCFIGKGDYRDFLSAPTGSGRDFAKGEKDCGTFTVKSGPILNREGQLLGRHKGIPFYTVGQRRGLGIAIGEPLYVVSIDKNSNSIMLGREKDLYSSSLLACDLNFMAFDKLEKPMEAKAKIRYLHQEADALVSPMPDGEVKVEFAKPQRAITPGQSVVFYAGDVLLGSARIKTSDSYQVIKPDEERKV
jgi:tRNA-specific 2-thiouridylase